MWSCSLVCHHQEPIPYLCLFVCIALFLFLLVNSNDGQIVVCCVDVGNRTVA